jgi:hypothetical protein
MSVTNELPLGTFNGNLTDVFQDYPSGTDLTIGLVNKEGELFLKIFYVPNTAGVKKKALAKATVRSTP